MNKKLSCFLKRCLAEAGKAGLFTGLLIVGFVVIVVWLWRGIYGQEEGLD